MLNVKLSEFTVIGGGGRGKGCEQEEAGSALNSCSDGGKTATIRREDAPERDYLRYELANGRAAGSNNWV